MTSNQNLKRLRIQTTVPRVPFPSSRGGGRGRTEELRTERLIIRPQRASDLWDYHELRTDPVVMINTAVGRPDRDLAETWSKLVTSLPPGTPMPATREEAAALDALPAPGPEAYDDAAAAVAAAAGGGGANGGGTDPRTDAVTYNHSIFLAGTGEFVGVGGMHSFDRSRFLSGRGGSLGSTGAPLSVKWPEVGYMILPRHWRRGYTSEFLSAWLADWWALPRETVSFDVLVEHDGEGSPGPVATLAGTEYRPVVTRYEKIGGGEGGEGEGEGEIGVAVVPEHVFAYTEVNSMGSLGVMRKNGFKVAFSQTEPDSRVGFEGKDATLVGSLLAAPKSFLDA